MIGGFIFNETSPSAAGTAASSQPVTGSTVAGVAAGGLDDYEAVNVVAEIKGATGDVLNVYMQTSLDAGNNWYDVIAWKQAAAAGPVAFYMSPFSLATTTSAPVTVGKNLSPALSAATNGTVVNGAWGDRLRLVMVAGASTSAGAQVIVRIAPQRLRTNQM